MSDRRFSLSTYPLSWPDGWRRTAPGLRKRGQFKSSGARMSVGTAVKRILEQLAMLHVRNDDVLVSSNIPTRLDGLPRSDAGEPADPGVAVYWRESQNAPMKCLAIDIYLRTADNLAACAATLEAMRAIERHGGAQVQERTFRGFAALPATTGKRHWREVLELDSEFAKHGRLTREIVQDRYRSLAGGRHPDRGGSEAAMAELNVARDEAFEEVG